MTASARMAGLVEAFGDAVADNVAMPDSAVSDPADAPAEATDQAESDARTVLLAAIGEIERDRDAQAERLAAFDSCNRARQAAEEEVAALKAEVARLRLDATNARQVAEEALDFHEALRRTIGRPPTCARTDDLRARIATPDPAAFVDALDAYGQWCGTIGASLATGGTQRFLADCERERDTCRAAVLALVGAR